MSKNKNIFKTMFSAIGSFFKKVGNLFLRGLGAIIDKILAPFPYNPNIPENPDYHARIKKTTTATTIKEPVKLDKPERSKLVDYNTVQRGVKSLWDLPPSDQNGHQGQRQHKEGKTHKPRK